MTWLVVAPRCGTLRFQKSTNIGYVELAVVAAAHAAAISTVATLLEAHGAAVPETAAATTTTDAAGTSAGAGVESRLSLPVLF